MKTVKNFDLEHSLLEWLWSIFCLGLTCKSFLDTQRLRVISYRIFKRTVETTMSPATMIVVTIRGEAVELPSFLKQESAYRGNETVFKKGHALTGFHVVHCVAASCSTNHKGQTERFFFAPNAFTFIQSGLVKTM